jgi:hypothetical protein
MSLLPECPCCGGLMTLSKRSTLSSACRCPFPDELDWSDFKALREPLAPVHRDTDPDTGNQRVAA